MYVRLKKNSSGSISVQIIEKIGGRNRLIKSVGCAKSQQEIDILYDEALKLIPAFTKQSTFDLFDNNHVDGDLNIFDTFIKSIKNNNIICIGPELIIGKIFDEIGFGSLVTDRLFRHLVIARLVYPGSKLKTIDYFLQYRNIELNATQIYRFMDKFHSQYKDDIENIAFNYTKQILGEIAVVFYDVTTLYFEASDEDDLRRIGYSKDGKFTNPQIMLGLLVGKQGYPIGYDIFSGNSFEGHTLIPILKKFQAKFNLSNPIVIADSGLLSKSNISNLKSHKYEYIIGARIKNTNSEVKNKIIDLKLFKDNTIGYVILDNGDRLIVTYDEQRAKNDEYNRKKGMARLEQKVKSKKLTKDAINNKGYNKYLVLKGDINVDIDYDKYTDDSKWDGLKGYITNAIMLSPNEAVENYSNLWHIEKAFRISKTDLQIRPIHHYLKHRIEAHISISFVAYTVYKEFERILEKHNTGISTKKAIEAIKTIYSVEYVNPITNKSKSELLGLNEMQLEIKRTIETEFG